MGDDSGEDTEDSIVRGGGRGDESAKKGMMVLLSEMRGFLLSEILEDLIEADVDGGDREI